MNVKVKRRRSKSLYFLTAIAGIMFPLAQAAWGSSTEWKVSDGGNGHLYEVVVLPDTLNWNQAKAFAENLGGYLATITSAAENDFVYGLVAATPGAELEDGTGPWLGGFQRTDSPTKSSGWQWVTTEGDFVYSNWEPTGSEPNDGWSDVEQNRENALHFKGAAFGYPGKWNDAPFDMSISSLVVEYDGGLPFETSAGQATLGFGPKANDDDFQTTLAFRLNAKGNGIDPRREDVRLTIGTFSTTIPSGSFKTYRQNRYPDKVRFDGVIDNVNLVVDIYSYGSNRYLLWAKGYGAKLDGTAVPVKMSLRIGDDYGDANLTVGSAQFKKVVVRPDGATCASIKASDPMAKDSVYTIDPDGSGGNEPVEVYCDMATAGGGWEVLFRGDDPGKWATTFGTPGKGQWGIDKTGLPSSISELRFSRVDTGEALSIPMTATDVYGCAPAGSNYFWNGTSYENFSARHLGVSDTVALTGPPEFEGYVITGEPCNNDHHSWGFGHRGWIDDRQAWGWDSQDLGPTAFQIQVR